MVAISPSTTHSVSDCGNVFKFFHPNGTETNIKLVPSCDTEWDEGKQDYVLNTKTRDKYSVFVSVSKGCFAKCKFCYLTTNNVKFAKIPANEIITNVTSSIEFVASQRPDIKEKYFKLCWMGMGDAYVESHKVLDATENIVTYVMEQGFAKGVDGVDLASIIPPIKLHNQHTYYNEVNTFLSAFETNPNHKEGRTPYRFFYSLHSAIQETREVLVPGTLPLPRALEQIQRIRESGINVVFHHMFFEGVNDTTREIMAIMAIWEKYNLYDCEFRILRFNESEGTDLTESSRLKYAADILRQQGILVKVQFSAGKDINAACGQFL